MSEAPILWQPGPERVARARLSAFLDEVRSEEASVRDYATLWQWSVQHPERFWARVWTFCEVLSEQGYERVVEGLDRMPGARWFPGARLNFAQNLLRFRDDHPALVSWNESGRRGELSYRQLYDEVRRVARGLATLGVEPGDRVAGFLPNLPEAVIAMLATASLGATWSSCSPDFGAQGVLDRFGQIQPKVLITTDATLYNGKQHPTLERAREVVRSLPDLSGLVVVPYLATELDLQGEGELDWRQLGAQPGSPAPNAGDGGEMEFFHTPFDHPLYILYSSGTTGLPKCMVHGAGGTLIQHLKELVLHCDLQREDRIFYYTTCGWMMWNWLVSSLAAGATVVLYDGAPMKPRREILWDLAQEEKLTVFGTSAKYLALAEKEGLQPKHSHDLQSLRLLLSTGSPLAPEGFDYVYRAIKQDLCLSSISGGTDLVSCFALGNPILPVRRGEIQCRGLGMAVEVWNGKGEPVQDETGELVCTRPFPTMPLSFWNDPEGQRYRAAYFERFPGIWRHGDWAELRSSGGLVIHGRSDATLNPGGVRLGTAEIYRQVEQLEEVLESLVVGQEWGDDTRVVLFVRLREGVSLDEELEQQLRQRIRAGASPHHVPRRILQVPDLPRTLSGKISELAVREVIHGRPVHNTEALANPESLRAFADRPELQV